MALFALLYLLLYLTLGLTLWAPISAIRRPDDRYPGSMSKRVWVTGLLVAISAQAVATLVWAFPFPTGFIAAWCYLILVVRPGRRRTQAT